ncbi:MAG TPA: DUF4159 domain-containing protein [Vicinamibacterales bacterium]|nr:DUF4159 domain-containing protein [Vicinamibacterales bacterium]
MRRVLFVVLVGMLSGSSTNAPQRDAPSRGHYSAPIRYDGRFTLVRLRWGAGSPPHGRFDAQDAWSHDYPRAEQNLSAIIRELTYLDIHDDGNEILTLDDPDLFKYPIALMWEPGFWTLTDREAESFRAYLLKGGFAIFEDFDGATQWANFEAQIHRVLPEARLIRLDSSHQVFNAFFPIEDIHAIVHPMSHIRPSYYGIFEDNDPSRRLIVVANYDNDVPEYWERSSQRLFPLDASNEAYKLGVNYLIYGLSH